MEKLVRIIDRISHVFGAISGIFMILGVVLVITEVIVRSVFNSTIYITEEYTSYFMVAITFFGLAYTMKEKGHIRMVFMHKLVKGGKARTLLDIYSFIVGLAIFLAITVVTTGFFLDSVESGTRSMSLMRTYVAIPQLAMPLGSLLMTLQFAAEIAKSIVKLRKGEYDQDDVESEALGR